MGKFPKLITLNDDNGSYQAWKKLFEQGDDNFSGWIQEKLLEELSRRLDPAFIYKKLTEAENTKSYWEGELNRAKEHEEAKKQKLEAVEEIEVTRESQERKFDLLIRKIGMYLQYTFKLNPVPAVNVCELLARDYIQLKEKPPIISFLESKGYKKPIK